LREGTVTSIIIPRSNSTESLPSYFSAVNNSQLSGPLSNTCKCKKSGQVVIYLKPTQQSHHQPPNSPSHLLISWDYPFNFKNLVFLNSLFSTLTRKMFTALFVFINFFHHCFWTQWCFLFCRSQMKAKTFLFSILYCTFWRTGIEDLVQKRIELMHVGVTIGKRKSNTIYSSVALFLSGEPFAQKATVSWFFLTSFFFKKEEKCQ
jgi:hypothetical protein